MTDSEEVSRRIDVLGQEYRLVSEDLSRAYGQMLQLLGIGGAALAALVGFVADRNVPVVVLWVAPLVVLTIYATAIIVCFRWVSLIFQARLMSARLAELSGEHPWLFYYHKGSVSSRFQSMHEGSPKYRMAIGGMVVMPVVIYVCLVVMSCWVIYSQNHLAGFCFVLIHAALLGVLLFVTSGVLDDLPQLYHAAEARLAAGEEPSSRLGIALTIAKRQLGLILPRPVDFFGKAVLFFVPAAIVLAEHGPQSRPVIDKLFLQTSGEMPPVWAAVAFSVCWFFVQEGLVQQAKYIWNDIRDRESDREYAGKKNRAMAGTGVTSRRMVPHLVVRWAIGLALGYLLDPTLFGLLCALSLVHVLYELWIKPNGGRYPLLALVTIASGAALRAFSGMASIHDGSTLGRLSLVAVGFLFYGVGYTSAFWRIEGDYHLRKGISKVRSQSAFFGTHGRRLEMLGLGAFVVCSTILLADAVMAGATGIGVWDQGVQFLLHMGIQERSIQVGALTLTASIWIAALGAPTGSILTRCFAGRRTRWLGLGMAAIICGGALSLALSLMPSQVSTRLAVGAILVALSIVALTTYTDITYEEYMFVNLTDNLPLVSAAWSRYLLDSRPGIRLAHVIWLTLHAPAKAKDALVAEIEMRGADTRGVRGFGVGRHGDI
jgi:4-hydroxybenzoate polyprenyltransferase